MTLTLSACLGDNLREDGQAAPHEAMPHSPQRQLHLSGSGPRNAEQDLWQVLQLRLHRQVYTMYPSVIMSSWIPHQDESSLRTLLGETLDTHTLLQGMHLVMSA